MIGHDGEMTDTSPIVKINAITVPEGMGDEVAKRFAERAGAVDGQEGFRGFSLLRPTDDRRTWLVLTEWDTEAAFDAWVSSPAFAHGHRAAVDTAQRADGEAQGGDEQDSDSRPPMGLTAELWSYEVEVRSDGNAD